MRRLAIIVTTTVLLVGLPQCTRDRPATPLNLAHAALANPRFVWDSIPGSGFTLYTYRGGYAAARASRYRDEVQTAISHALATLGETRSVPHLKVFVAGSREDVEAVVGVGWNGWSDAPGKNAGVVARAECRPVFRHEIMHLVSLVLWGHPLGAEGDPHPPNDRVVFEQGGWLREGIAAAAEDLYVTYSYRGMAAQWLAEGALIPVDTLVHSFYRQDDLAAYLQSGSLVQYLLEKYGSARFRLLWRDGASAFARVYGRTVSQLEIDWQAWLAATPASARPPSIAVARAEDRCPQRRR